MTWIIRSIAICSAFMCIVAYGPLAFAQEPSSATAVADALLWGRPLPTADRTADLPPAVQPSLAAYRRCVAMFRSSLGAPRDPTPDEQQLFERRVGLERVVVCLFDNRGRGGVAAAYALDVDLGSQEAEFIDVLLQHLRWPWLAPYLNLVAGDLKLCAGDEASGQRQLAAARDGGPLIQFVAETLLREKRCPDDLGR
jgi:hypothetical protein